MLFVPQFSADTDCRFDLPLLYSADIPAAPWNKPDSSPRRVIAEKIDLPPFSLKIKRMDRLV